MFKYEEILKQLDKFIEKYVLCPNCKLPEIHLRVRSKKEIHGKCESCGFKGPMDNQHKIINLMLDSKPIKWGIEEKQKKSEMTNEFSQQAKQKTQDVLKGKDIDIGSEILGKNTRPNSRHSLPLSTWNCSRDRESGRNKLIPSNRPSNIPSLAQRLQTHSNCSIPYSYPFPPDCLSPANHIKQIRELYLEHVEVVDNKTQLKEKDTLIKDVTEALNTITLENKNMNRIYFVLFSAVFSINIALEIELNADLLKQVSKRFSFDIQLETLLNLQHHCFTVHAREKFQKLVPTILKLFYDQDILTEQVLLDWSKQKEKSQIEKFFKNSFLLKVDNNTQFLEDAQQIIDWLR